MIRHILFDFDGVISDSMDIRDYGFREIVKSYDKELVDEFIKYHRYNGGLSRYVKIRYFYEEMLGESITEEKVNELAAQFSKIMRKHLVTPDIIIQETYDYIASIYSDISLHIVSGSDEQELNFLCRALRLDQFFITIEGSPTHKNDLVSGILEKYNYKPEEIILICDSINDYDAAEVNGIGFYAYNNPDLSTKGLGYIDSFKDVPFKNEV